MAGKKKSTLAKVAGAVQDAAASKARAAGEHVVEPAGRAVGLTGTKMGEDPTGPKTAAVRMMTRSVALKKPARSKSKAQRAAAGARPSQKPADGRGGKVR
jgi:hypothetical protein